MMPLYQKVDPFRKPLVESVQNGGAQPGSQEAKDAIQRAKNLIEATKIKKENSTKRLFLDKNQDL